VQLSVTEENYIKSVFHLQNGDSLVSTNELSAALRTTPASVTDMLKKLTAKQILIYEKYRGVKLNDKGQLLALGIIRNHRLWEYFLVNILHFGWDEVHAIAEELEHITSKKLVEQLDNFLGNPKFDPHGDPIPDVYGVMIEQEQLNLENLPAGIPLEVSGVGSQSTELLEILKHHQIAIGTRLMIKRKFSFDQSFEIELTNGELFTISQQLAQALLVKIIVL
jgi:DtxR family Mn-dependent transcriptional regulator